MDPVFVCFAFAILSTSYIMPWLRRRHPRWVLVSDCYQSLLLAALSFLFAFLCLGPLGQYPHATWSTDFWMASLGTLCVVMGLWCLWRLVVRARAGLRPTGADAL